jgi:hypothetical protein
MGCECSGASVMNVDAREGRGIERGQGKCKSRPASAKCLQYKRTSGGNPKGQYAFRCAFLSFSGAGIMSLHVRKCICIDMKGPTALHIFTTRSVQLSASPI